MHEIPCVASGGRALFRQHASSTTHDSVIVDHRDERVTLHASASPVAASTNGARVKEQGRPRGAARQRRRSFEVHMACLDSHGSRRAHPPSFLAAARPSAAAVDQSAIRGTLVHDVTSHLNIHTHGVAQIGAVDGDAFQRMGAGAGALSHAGGTLTLTSGVRGGGVRVYIFL